MAYPLLDFPETIKLDKHCILREKNIDHFDEFVAVAKKNRDHLYRWLPWAQKIPNELSRDHYNNAPNEKRNNVSAEWDIFYDNKLCGAIGIMNRGADGTSLEIGYWLAEERTGNGIITQSVLKLCHLAFELTDAPYVEIGCDIKNTASASVAKRAGFSLVEKISKPTHVPHCETAAIYRLYK